MAGTPVVITSDSSPTDAGKPLGTTTNPLITQAAVGAATSATKIEDTASANGDAGSASLWRRNDTRASTTDTDGDYHNPAVDAFGSVWARDSILLTNDMTSVLLSMNTITTTAVVAGVASQTIRVHRMRISADAAQQITIQDAATPLEVISFIAAGSRILDFSTRPWYKCSTAAALNFVTTTTGQVRGVVEYIQSAT